MDFLKQELLDLQERGLFRSLKSINSPQDSTLIMSGRTVLNFCSNNYLGLANHPRMIQASRDALKYGTGSGAARLVTGNYDLHQELEEGLAKWKGTESALLFNSGYHANIGVIPALAGEGDIIFSDELNHASLIDGCRLSRAEKVIYRHHDLNHLEELLRDCRGAINRAPTRHLFIITEAIFSMEGDLCPLDDLLALTKKYNATVYLDEAHAVGVLGERGQGLAPLNPPENLICMGTLGKAFGSYGAFVAGSKTLKDYLINKARSFIFTTALPPSAVGASLAALKIIREEPERREQLWENVKNVGARFSRPGGRPRKGTASLTPPLHGVSPIFSIPIGDAQKTMEVSQKLFEQGIFLQGIRPPTVPDGTSRLRLTVMATHTKEQLDHLMNGLQCVPDFACRAV